MVRGLLRYRKQTSSLKQRQAYAWQRKLTVPTLRKLPCEAKQKSLYDDKNGRQERGLVRGALGMGAYYMRRQDKVRAGLPGLSTLLP